MIASIIELIGAFVMRKTILQSIAKRGYNMEGFITRAEHDEFCRRLDEENKRQNRRLEIVEDTMRQIGALTTSVEKLAVNMKSMLKEQEEQGARLKTLEGRDGEMWRKVLGYAITAVVGIVLGFVFTQIGMQ